MREGWEMKYFERLFDIPLKNGIYKSNIYEGSGVHIVKMKQQFGQRFIKTNEEFERIELTISEIKRTKLELNDILFSRTSVVADGVGKCSIVKEMIETTVFDSNIIRVRLNNQICSPLYYFYYFDSTLGRSQILTLSSGTNVKTIKGSSLRKLKISSPPLPTQRKIASILSAYDDLIENNLKRIQLLEEKARLTYEEWFVRMKFPGHETTSMDEETGLPEGWEKKKLGEVVSLQQGFALNKKSKHHISSEKTNFPLLKIGDLFNGTETLFVKDTIPKQFLVNKDEIIYSRTGQVGHAFMGRKGVIYNNCFRVSANQKIERILLYYFLISKPIIETAKALATGSAQPDLNHGAFKSIKITLAPLSLQKKFSATATQTLNTIYNLKDQNSLLKEARDILLPRLMTGLVDVEELV